MKRTATICARGLVFSVGAVVLFNGIMLFILSNFNLGNILTLLLGAALLLYGVFFRKVNRDFPRWLRTVLAAGLALLLAFMSFLLVYGTVDTVSYEEDALIVLGAAVHGETPSAVLRGRLDAAAEYYEKNPDVIIVVSGGQGPQEDVTEAYAMEKYLLFRGIPQTNIIKEERATSTFENFKFSKELLDERFDGDYTVAFVTNEFHIYRAGGYCAQAGLENTAHLHSNTRFDSILPGTLRECLAVLYFWVF